jgi:chitinase
MFDSMQVYGSVLNSVTAFALLILCWSSTQCRLLYSHLPACFPLSATAYVNVVIVSFAKPDCSYTKGSYQLTSTGLDFSSDGTVVKDAIAALKSANPNSRVLLAVGGATYYNFAATKPQCIKDIIDDFGFDGMDFDWEPVNSDCLVNAGQTGGVSCATDAEGVSVLSALRAALPKGQYLMSTASW